ncbi:IS256 family transposase [Streptomyces lavendulocolor]|uniref:IS256 family transposase n=1 Tax=Streptomyces lavendulocolor TaxID=67316 RepID=UPI0033EC43FF
MTFHLRKGDLSVLESMSLPDEETKQRGEDIFMRVAESVLAELRSGGSLMGDGGLLQQFTKRVIEMTLELEISTHIESECGNSRNGYRSKNLLTEFGPMEVQIPRDRLGTFRPISTARWERRTSGIDDLVMSLLSRGLTTGEVVDHLREVYDVASTKTTISAITQRVHKEMERWCGRPLQSVYPLLSVDAFPVKVRGTEVVDRRMWAAVATDPAGQMEVLGLWLDAEGPRGNQHSFVTEVFADMRRRGAETVGVVLSGVPDADEAARRAWPSAVVQPAISRTTHAAVRLVKKYDVPALERGFREVLCTASEKEALIAEQALADAWGRRYPRLSEEIHKACNAFAPTLAMDARIRRALISFDVTTVQTMARFRKAARTSAQFPSTSSAMKRMYLLCRSGDFPNNAEQYWDATWHDAQRAFQQAFTQTLAPPVAPIRGTRKIT